MTSRIARISLGCCLLGILTFGVTGAKDATYLERYTANAMSLSSTNMNTTSIEIAISEWSSEEDRATLVTAAEQSSDDLSKALEGLEEHGFVSFGTHRHSIRYARKYQDGDKTIVMVGSYRILTSSEARGTNLGHSEDYTVAFAQLELNAKGKGTGTLTPAAKVTYDGDKNKLNVETLNNQPFRLSGVRTHTPGDKK